MCVCRLRYPACNAHAPYCHMWPVWLYNIFPRYLIHSTIFDEGNKGTERNIYVLIFCTTFVRNICHSKNKGAWSKMYIYLHVKYPLFFFEFHGTWIFSTDLRKTHIYKILRKSVQWELSSMQTDRRRDMTKIIVVFRNFANAPKKYCKAIIKKMCKCKNFLNQSLN
jgi:hypothetical protein